jgi:hypothetical protein
MVADECQDVCAITLVLAFLVLRDDFVTTLHACRVPRRSLTSYTRAKPPSPRRPIRTYWELRCWSMMIFGGEGGVTFAFCRGKGGELGLFPLSATGSCFCGGRGRWLLVVVGPTAIVDVGERVSFLLDRG